MVVIFFGFDDCLWICVFMVGFVYFVVMEIWFFGWCVLVDGCEVFVFCVNYVFCVVWVLGGEY